MKDTTLRLDCSEPLKNLIRRMLAVEERDRPTMQQVCDALEESKLPPTVAAARIEKPAVRPAQPEESKLPPVPSMAVAKNDPVVRPARPEESILPPYPTPPQTQLVRLTNSTIEFLDFQREVLP